LCSRTVCCTRRIRSRLKGIPTGKKNSSWIRCACCTVCGLLRESKVPAQLLVKPYLYVVRWKWHRPNPLPMHVGSSSLNVTTINRRKFRQFPQ
jgi:hypothetical protein